MLKVTFPHLGNAYIPFRILLSELGVEPVVPPFTSRKTISLGTRLAPEFACYPLKVNLGNYLEAIDAGAEAIFMAGGVGPCRFGYYGELQREILREAGYDLEFIVLEAPKTHPRELWEKLKRYLPRHSPADIVRAAYFAWLKAESLDQFDRLANQIRPVEVHAGMTDRAQMKFYHRLDQAGTIGTIHWVKKEALEELHGIPVLTDINLLKIVLLGEIFMVLESRVNFGLERLCGELGAEAVRTIYFTEWVYETLFLSLVQPDWRKKYLMLAKPYLSHFVGGHGVETVAHTVSAKFQGYHGVVQLAPFTCMPEVVAMQAIVTVTRDLEIPVLTVIIDEHSAEAGIRTRLEAFIDLLRYRNKQEKKQRRKVKSV